MSSYIRKIDSAASPVNANTYIGLPGIIFYDPNIPVLRLSNGNTEGGLIIGISTQIINNTAPVSGQFKVAHNLGFVPQGVIIQNTYNTVGGQIWLYTANIAKGFDNIYVYLISSDINISSQIILLI